MNNEKPLIITISRQLGSGGNYLGKKIAEKLGIIFANREILKSASHKLSMVEDSIHSLNEKNKIYLNSLLEINTFSPDEFALREMLLPTERDVFNIESELIRNLVDTNSAVIIGRVGFYILRDYPNHISILLNGDVASRAKRLSEKYEISENEAKLIIIKNDRERYLYCREYTGREWTDAKNFNLCINTSKTGLEQSFEIITNYINLYKKQ